MASRTRSTNFCFTAYAPNLNIEWLTAIKCDYWTYGVETCPKTKKIHWQGYMELAGRTYFATLKKKIPQGIHIELRKGTGAQAIAYCHKDGQHESFGVAKSPPGPRKGGEALLECQAALDNGATEGDLATDNFVEWVKHRKSFAAYGQLNQPERDWETEVHFIHGPTGSGKTRYCVDKGAVMVEFDKGGFCHNYQNQPILLFDDFDVSTITRSRFLQLTDRYATTVNVKGESKIWNPKVIYITSNFPCSDWYNGCPAVQRRVTTNTYMPYVERKSAQMEAAAAMIEIADSGNKNLQEPESQRVVEEELSDGDLGSLEELPFGHVPRASKKRKRDAIAFHAGRLTGAKYVIN